MSHKCKNQTDLLQVSATQPDCLTWKFVNKHRRGNHSLGGDLYEGRTAPTATWLVTCRREDGVAECQPESAGPSAGMANRQQYDKGEC